MGSEIAGEEGDCRVFFWEGGGWEMGWDGWEIGDGCLGDMVGCWMEATVRTSVKGLEWSRMAMGGNAGDGMGNLCTILYCTG